MWHHHLPSRDAAQMPSVAPEPQLCLLQGGRHQGMCCPALRDHVAVPVLLLCWNCCSGECTTLQEQGLSGRPGSVKSLGEHDAAPNPPTPGEGQAGEPWDSQRLPPSPRSALAHPCAPLTISMKTASSSARHSRTSWFRMWSRAWARFRKEVVPIGLAGNGQRQQQRQCLRPGTIL